MKNHRALSLLVVISSSVLLAGCTSFSGGPVGNSAIPEPAKSVDLNRYLGRWYEIGRYEAKFQKDCEAVSADYSLNENGTIKVINTCRKNSVDGKLTTATGKAKIVEGSQNAKLKVSFFGPFYGDYWILDRHENYDWAIVGEPSGRYLWMLSRTANPSQETKSTILQRVAELGYNLDLIRTTKQP